MEVNSLSKTYYVRKLDKNDVEMIYDMSCKNHIFYQYHPPFVTRESILEDMEALPPGKGYDDKFYVGFFENESLGYKKIGIGVDKGNPQSYSFWTKNNFSVIREEQYIRMEREI